MCNKHSFLLTRAGKILDGGGLTESHSEIASLHGVDEDRCNRYEWQPPTNWPDAEAFDGLTKDAEVFTPGASALRRVETYLRDKFPTAAVFGMPTPIDERWHEQAVMLGGREMTVICRPVATALTSGPFWVVDQTVEAGDNATVRAGDNATVRAGDNATVEAWGNATVQAEGNATVRAWGNATVIYPHGWWHNKVTTKLRDQAVLIDRRNSRVVVVGPSDTQCSPDAN